MTGFMERIERAEKKGKEAGRKDAGLSKYRTEFTGNEWHAFMRGYLAGKREAQLAKKRKQW